jgi:hypothetical protein
MATKEQARPRWRFRIRTLMLLVIIIALSLALVSEQRRRVERARRMEELAFREAINQALTFSEVELLPGTLEVKVPVEAFMESQGPPPESPGRATEKVGR